MSELPRLELEASPVRQRKAAELAADVLRRHIVEAGKAGDYLPTERELLARLAISRPTLREALRVLESEGLLEIKRGARGGAVIRETSIDALARTFGVHLQRRKTTLHELNEARTILEPAAARLAAERYARLDSSVTEVLDEALSAESNAVASDDDAYLLAATTRFYDAVRELSGNEILVVIGQLLDELVRIHAPAVFRRVGSSGDQTRKRAVATSLRTHTRLADAIKRGDADEAERLTRKHMTSLLRADDAIDAPSIDMFSSSMRPGEHA